MHKFKKFAVITDVVLRVIMLAGRDAQDGIILQPEHIAPQARVQDKPFRGIVQQDFPSLPAIVQFDQYSARTAEY